MFVGQKILILHDCPWYIQLYIYTVYIYIYITLYKDIRWWGSLLASMGTIEQPLVMSSWFSLPKEAPIHHWDGYWRLSHYSPLPFRFDIAMEHGPFSSMIYVDIPIKSGDMFQFAKCFGPFVITRGYLKKGYPPSPQMTKASHRNGNGAWVSVTGPRLWSWRNGWFFFAEKKTSGL